MFFATTGEASRHTAARRLRVTAALAILLAGLLGLILPAVRPAAAQSTAGTVVVIELDGAIDNVSARYLKRAMDEAQEGGAELIVIQLDTPGGLLSSTRDIVNAIFASPVPVAVYVAPEGAHAGSAGTFIGAAAAILAMAPATDIGAASVVGSGGEELPETLGRKATEDAAALIRSIAQTRGRNAEALEATVREAIAYSAQEAVDQDIADLIAPSLGELLDTIDGRTVPVANGEVVLDTAEAPIRREGMSLVERALSFLADPNIAFLFVTLGGVGLLVELWNPGLWIPGTLGAAFLILGFAGVGNLPFSWAGVALIVLAFLLFFLEAQAPGIGYFGVAGAIALILGGVFLFGFFGSPSLPGYSVYVSRWLLIGMGVGAGATVLWLARAIRQSQKIPPYVSPSSTAHLVGQMAQVTRRLEPRGEVRVAGEEWTAVAADGVPIEPGQWVTVTAVDGMVLSVAKGVVSGGATGS